MSLMNRENRYKKVILMQAEEIKDLRNQVTELTKKLEEKDIALKSFEPIRQEFMDTMQELKDKHSEYMGLVAQLEEMKHGVDKAIYSGKWNKIKKMINTPQRK